MKIKASQAMYAPSLEYTWAAYDDDTYDGADDSSTRYDIGYGVTEQDAVNSLLRLLEEKRQ